MKSVRGLSRRPARRRTGRILVEGPQGVREAVRFAPERIVDLYVTDEAAQRYADFIDPAREAGVFVHRTSDEVLAAMCDADTPQGTAAVVVAAVLSAVKSSGIPLSKHRIVIYGAGSAGTGIANLLVQLMVSQGVDEKTARSHFWGLGSRGLLREGLRLRDFQRPFARSKKELEGWILDSPDQYTLNDVVRNVHPTILIGCSAQPGAFTENIVTTMVSHCERPVIMPLSNPTRKAEALPSDILKWTDGRALVATGSPFKPVMVNGVTYQIAQANNALVFPGIGLGAIAVRASRVTSGMIAAAAEAVALRADSRVVGASLLPSIKNLRPLSASVAIAVAEQAMEEGVATEVTDNPVEKVFSAMWQPRYPRIAVD